MYTYLIINIAIIIVPLLFSFEKQIRFYRYIPHVLFSILAVSPVFLIWDAIFTARGVWGFNPEYILGIYWFGLPMEEILFFITVPFSSIFIYEVVRVYLSSREIKFQKNTLWQIPILFGWVALFLWKLEYTLIVSLFGSLVFLLSHFLNKELIITTHFWKSILVSFVPFFIVNYILTSLPVVIYNDNENIGYRLFTIPLEDFVYSFAMISLWLFFYHYSRQKNNRKDIYK